MGFWDKLVGGVGRAVDVGSRLYDSYDQARGMYRDAIPRNSRRKLERNVRGLGYRARNAVSNYGGRALGGIANAFRRPQPQQESLVDNLRSNQYETPSGQTGRQRQQVNQSFGQHMASTDRYNNSGAGRTGRARQRY